MRKNLRRRRKKAGGNGRCRDRRPRLSVISFFIPISRANTVRPYGLRRSHRRGDSRRLRHIARNIAHFTDIAGAYGMRPYGIFLSPASWELSQRESLSQASPYGGGGGEADGEGISPPHAKRTPSGVLLSIHLRKIILFWSRKNGSSCNWGTWPSVCGLCGWWCIIDRAWA